MINTRIHDNCCGCQTCKLSCPTKAISMQYDDKGFLYPNIDEKKCINCNICENVCDFIKHDKNNNTIINSYAFQIEDKDKLYQSTSGGAFTLLSDYILKSSGYIVGTILTENFETKYIFGNKEEMRDSMRGSKYVQSFTDNIFCDVYSLLKNNKKVLFIGTPCHVAALNSYLNFKKANIANLYTIDFICHGVASEKIFKEHLHYLEQKYKSSIVNYLFRDKKYGWCHTETAIFSDGKCKSNKSVYQLKELFQNNINLRESCYHCAYANKNRVSDITIGDFWGADEILHKYDFKGVSLILTNTSKGEFLLRKSTVDYSKSYLFENFYHPLHQGGLNHPVEKPKDSDLFWELYFENGYEKAIDEYAPISNTYMLYIYLKRIIHFFKLDSFFIKMKVLMRGKTNGTLK